MWRVQVESMQSKVRGDTTRTACNWTEMRIINRTRGILENKGALTVITNAPRAPQATLHNLPHETAGKH